MNSDRNATSLDERPADSSARRQSPSRIWTLLTAVPEGTALAPIWVGVTGRDQRLTITVAPTPGRSPHYWFGPSVAPGEDFELQLAMHFGMGPGGLLWRTVDTAPWSSLRSASPWGLERLSWPERWTVGSQGEGTLGDGFRGEGLAVSHTIVY